MIVRIAIMLSYKIIALALFRQLLSNRTVKQIFSTRGCFIPVGDVLHTTVLNYPTFEINSLSFGAGSDQATFIFETFDEDEEVNGKVAASAKKGSSKDVTLNMDIF